jgi:hypothetical protein
MLPENHSRPPAVYLAPDSHGWDDLELSRPVFLVSPLGRIEVHPKQLSGLHPEVVLYRRGDWLKLGGWNQSVHRRPGNGSGQGAAYYAQHVRLEN